MTIPYQVRYQPVGDEDVTYTAKEQELEIIVGGTQDASSESSDEATDDEVPGFDMMLVAISVLLLMVGMRSVASKE